MLRFKAAGVHLSFSLAVFFIVLTVLLYFWYPAPYFTASGGWQGLKIAAAVDLVLGPLLTFIVYENTKSKAKLLGDLTFIVLIQFSAFGYGINTIYQQRPVAIVFWENSFLTVPALSLNRQNVSVADLSEFGSDYPVYIYVEKPKDIKGLTLMSRTTLEQQVPPHHQVNLYRRLSHYYSEIKPFQADIHQITEINSVMKEKLELILAESSTEREDYDYYPLKSKYHNIILMFSHKGELKNHIAVPLRD